MLNGMLRTAILWSITQGVVVISYRLIGTTIGRICWGQELLSRNVGKKLPQLAEYSPIRAQLSATSRWHPEITLLVSTKS